MKQSALLGALLAARSDPFEPYVAADADRSSGTAPNAHLAGSTNWSAYHLLKGGEHPYTRELARAVPVPDPKIARARREAVSAA